MSEIENICKNAKKASFELLTLGSEEKNEILQREAYALEKNADAIILSNALDMKNGKEKGLSEGLLDRLLLTRERIKKIADAMREVALLPDPIGETVSGFVRPNGLEITEKRVPMGVIGVIYEARPNVTADIASLCLKTSNAVVLKGGSDAINSNKAIVDAFRAVLSDMGYDQNFVTLIGETERSATEEFMHQDRYVDLLIPRGGAGLIRTVKENSTIPCIETGTGNCHIFVDESADLDKALPIIENAKTQRIGVCNAMESLVVHEKIKDELLSGLIERLKKYDISYHADESSIGAFKGDKVSPATEEDFGKEYLALELSIKTVSSLEEAIEHINTYSTHHSDAIITENYENARVFLQKVDSACVYVNASTRFTDGGEFGFGAEVGISTQKLHARGPMGLKALTTTKYTILGNGQIRP
ncbi:MAG: glutamate-5-semialdehyde dehydrogenase [Lachnospiraceae bacterium]|nr:glutamate-5-semialdehyde dehydrogenase [Lachnospiraceae bacterium]